MDNILIVYPGDIVGYGNRDRIINVCKAWHRHGHDVSILMAQSMVEDFSKLLLRESLNVKIISVPWTKAIKKLSYIKIVLSYIPRALFGCMVKLPDDGNPATQYDSAVYYVGTDGKRHAFPNEKVYFSWYCGFDKVQVISADKMAAMPLGLNITYEPGKKMVKFVTDNRVFVVDVGGTLRWIKTEAVASALYGANWNKQIDDIADVFYRNYKFGEDVAFAGAYNASEAERAVSFPSDSLNIDGHARSVAQVSDRACLASW